MKGKPILPYAIRQACLWIVRDYSRAEAEYREAREQILRGTPVRFKDKRDPRTGKYTRIYLPPVHDASRTTEDKAVQLNELNKRSDAVRLKAVSRARRRIGADLPDELRRKLQKAIMLSCENGREWPYERLDVPGIARSEFYERRAAFLTDIAVYLRLI